jgi:hypothetical protein
MKPKLWWLLVLLAPLLLGAAMVGWQSGEDAILQRAAATLERGQPEQALIDLKPLLRRPLLSSSARRRGAALYFRMGQDGRAHTLLRGQRYDGKDAADVELRTLAERCLKAGKALKAADRSNDAMERLRLVRSAQVELPDSPLVLQRVVLEELGALTLAPTPAEAERMTEEFLQDYQALRMRAPSLADEVKRKAGERLAMPAGGAMKELL